MNMSATVSMALCVLFNRCSQMCYIGLSTFQFEDKTFSQKPNNHVALLRARSSAHRKIVGNATKYTGESLSGSLEVSCSMGPNDFKPSSRAPLH